jgi:hypothetical protein
MKPNWSLMHENVILIVCSLKSYGAYYIYLIYQYLKVYVTYGWKSQRTSADNQIDPVFIRQKFYLNSWCTATLSTFSNPLLFPEYFFFT